MNKRLPPPTRAHDATHVGLLIVDCNGSWGWRSHDSNHVAQTPQPIRVCSRDDDASEENIVDHDIIAGGSSHQQYSLCAHCIAVPNGMSALHVHAMDGDDSCQGLLVQYRRGNRQRLQYVAGDAALSKVLLPTFLRVLPLPSGLLARLATVSLELARLATVLLSGSWGSRSRGSSQRTSKYGGAKEC